MIKDFQINNSKTLKTPYKGSFGANVDKYDFGKEHIQNGTAKHAIIVIEMFKLGLT